MWKQIVNILLKNLSDMDAKMKVLETMKKEASPLNAGKITELTQLERKEVDKAMAELKKEGAIVSPKRCYWQAK